MSKPVPLKSEIFSAIEIPFAFHKKQQRRWSEWVLTLVLDICFWKSCSQLFITKWVLLKLYPFFFWSKASQVVLKIAPPMFFFFFDNSEHIPIQISNHLGPELTHQTGGVHYGLRQRTSGKSREFKSRVRFEPRTKGVIKSLLTTEPPSWGRFQCCSLKWC